MLTRVPDASPQGAAKAAPIPASAAPNPDFDLPGLSEGIGRAQKVPTSRRAADLRKQLEQVRNRVGEVKLRQDALGQMESRAVLAKAKKEQALKNCQAEISLLHNLYQHYANELVDAETEQAELDAVERIASGDTVPNVSKTSAK